MRSLLALPACALVLAGPARAEPVQQAAAAFLASLDEGERHDAVWEFASDERHDVHYAPIGLDGIRHGELSERSKRLGEALLATALSEGGHERTRVIRALERDVAAREADRFWGFATGWMRDPGRYFWAFFGAPSDAEAWGFRFEGHHLSLNLTRVPGEAPASTPLFLGAQPRVVPEGLPSAGTAALGEEEALARRLYASLPGALRTKATLPYEDDRGHMIGQVARLETPTPTPIGVSRAALAPEQRALLDALVERFVSLWSGEIAAARRAEIDAVRHRLHFAHVEADDPPNAFYTRVSAPGVLIEIDNTSDGDHVHAVWHRPGGDFADDLLARHWRVDHGLALRR